MYFNIFYGTLNFLVPLVICLGTVYGVFQDRIRRTKLQMICAVIIDIILMFAAAFIFEKHAGLNSSIVYVLVLGAAVTAGCYYIFRSRITELLFIFFIIKCFMDAIFCIAKLIQYYIVPCLFTASLSVGFCFSYLAAFLIAVCPMWLFVRKLLRPLVNKTEYMKFWYLVWMVPVLFYLLYRLGISPNYKRPELLMEGTERFLTLIWIAAVFVSLAVMVKMMLETSKGVEEREKRKAFERLLTLQQESYRKIQSGVEYARKLNHDQRHHFLVVRAFAESGNIEGLKQYMDEYQDVILMKEPIMVCDNYIINAVAQHMCERAGRAGAKIDTRLDIPVDCGVAQSDLVVVIGNLLENAVEACERQKNGEKFIKIKGYWVSEKVLAILLENSFSNEVKEKDGSFLSSKSGSEGIGISSVKQIAVKYNGVAKFEYDNRKGVFKASVLLNL